MSDEMDPDQDGDSGQDDETDESGFSGFETNADDADSASLLEDWGGGELEAAYLKALSALEASESEMPQTVQRVSSGHNERISGGFPSESGEQEPESVFDDSAVPDEQSVVEPLEESEAPATDVPDVAIPATALRRSEPQPSTSQDLPAATLPPSPRQIIEACLFVGGAALPAKRLSGILRGEFDSDFVEREIDALNRLYAAENRPYEIQMGEGGYRLTLREEFERIRYKVYGLGPKEVRLSQEALEVLAVVAYLQPIKQSGIEELGKPGCGPVLRQLVRRQLIAVERDPANPRDVNYKTTPRFLSLFDIRSLDELPRHEQVAYK